MNAAPIRMFSPARTRICKDALRAGSSAMVWATTPCAFQSPIRTAAKGTAASRRGIHSIDRFRSRRTSAALRGSISDRTRQENIQASERSIRRAA